MAGVTSAISGYSANAKMLVGRVVGADDEVIIVDRDGNYPGLDGEVLTLSGVIRIA